MDTRGRRACRFIQLRLGLIKLLAVRQVTVIFSTRARPLTVSHTQIHTGRGEVEGDGGPLNAKFVQSTIPTKNLWVLPPDRSDVRLQRLLWCNWWPNEWLGLVSEQSVSAWRLSCRCARHMGDVGDTGCDRGVWLEWGARGQQLIGTGATWLFKIELINETRMSHFLFRVRIIISN